MRKIEESMNNAIYNRKNWTSGNTQVTFNKSQLNEIDSYCTVHLHGNLIARFEYTNDKLSEAIFYDGGWQSNTTKSRLNALAWRNGFKGVYQKNFKWYYSDGTPFESGKSVLKEVIQNA